MWGVEPTDVTLTYPGQIAPDVLSRPPRSGVFIIRTTLFPICANDISESLRKASKRRSRITLDVLGIDQSRSMSFSESRVGIRQSQFHSYH